METLHPMVTDLDKTEKAFPKIHYCWLGFDKVRTVWLKTPREFHAGKYAHPIRLKGLRSAGQSGEKPCFHVSCE